MKLIATVFLIILSAAADKAKFDGYRVHSLVPQNEEQLMALRGLESINEYNFWTEVRFANYSVDVMVPPHKRSDFDDFIKRNNILQTIKIENIQSLIDDEEAITRTRSKSFDWKNYHDLDEIYAWLDSLAERFPKIVKVVVGGKSYEGRDIKGIEINFQTDSRAPGVFLETGIHAREWIGPAATSWMVNEILTGNVDPLFREFNYLYFPSFNPDGYDYTWKKNRLWRKTRTPYKTSSAICYGADPNRNWDFHWNEVGVSHDPCSETYSGPSAFSEIETKTMSDYLTKVIHSRNQKIYISYHSYSQLIMYPWGYTMEPSQDDPIFARIANAAAKGLASVHGEKFEVGSIATIIYPTSGTSVEWHYHQSNASLNFAYELRDKGKYGFVLPAKYIVPSGEEILASLKEILSEYKKLRQ